MTSTSSEQRQDPDIESTLVAIESDASSQPPSGADSDLADRLDRIELLVEEVALARELQKSVSEYVNDIREEHADLRNFRWWATTFATVAACGLFGVLLWLIVGGPQWFLELDGKFQFAALASLGGGSVVLFSMILKGLYRGRNERHQDDLIPEHIKVLMEAARGQSST